MGPSPLLWLGGAANGARHFACPVVTLQWAKDRSGPKAILETGPIDPRRVGGRIASAALAALLYPGTGGTARLAAHDRRELRIKDKM